MGLNDPIWFGNYIIPRWEAFAFLFGGIAVAIIGVGCIAFLLWWALFSPVGH